MVAIVHHHILPRVSTGVNDWIPDYPNPADFQFDYYKLLALAASNDGGIGSAPGPGINVAVVGAGAAGMTAARELFRAGYNVTIFEASNRLCGRHWTVQGSAATGMELGAMRFPFFPAPGANNSVFEYYLRTEADAIIFPFPNPGSAPNDTGIYLSQGYGPNDQFYPTPTMISWLYGQEAPDNPALAAVSTLVNNFINFFTGVVGGTNDNPGLYASPDWPVYWAQIANNYDKMSFSDLVFSPAINSYNNDGWLGGFGMNDAQSQLFYTIGAGDGSWGAFYEIAAMWFIRCVMFGFNSDLQTLTGLNGASSLPYYNDWFLNDSAGNRLPAPLYSGIQSLVEWLFYNPAPGATQSLFNAVNDGGGASLFINRAVQSITWNDSNLIVHDQSGSDTAFDYVVVTPEIWASQLGVIFKGFSPNDMPSTTLAARDQQHIIASCKVFFPLTEPYWEDPNCAIPQDIVTDTFVQDAYGIKWQPNDTGVLLASYTWEDDALKLLPYNDAQVAQMVLAELDRITTTTLGNDQTVSQYVTDLNDAVVFQWSQQVGYNGCAKLYRQRDWTQSYSLLAYNQQLSHSSRLYLAGETFGVEGGWTEPALRMALDAVIRIIQNSGGSFVPGFDVANDYPRFDVIFTPNYNYNVSVNPPPKPKRTTS
ncbi:MAG TPA: FAD-dependent oxidoreductase [Thermoanaerobaculia bacterium]|nr:FAD-dependent oxidoreductase [Thermoanaerobaculia bacterium]